MDTILQDLRYAVRTLARMRGVAIVAITTLALGIGATTTMFSVVYAALLRPPPFAEPDRLVMLYVTRTTPRDGLVRLRWSRPVIARLEDLVQPSARPAGVSSFEAIASVTGASVALSGGTSVPEQIDGELVSPGYFTTLRIAPSAGRTFLAGDDGVPGAPPLAIVSDRLWRRRFAADPSLVGRTVRVSDVPLTVIGIAPPGFLGITGKADLWMPRTMAPTLTYSDYLITPQHFISVVARLRPGVTVDQANAELAAVASFAAPSLDFRVLLFATVVSLGTTMVFALAPAVGASRPNLVSALKEEDRGGSRGRALAGVAVSEVALAVLLLAAAGLLVESFARMQSLRRGFATDRAFTFWVRPPNSRYEPADGPAIVERLLTRIERTPGVESASLRRAVASVDSAVPIFDVMTLDERIAQALSRPQFNATIVAAFAAAALLLAALGVYGVLSASVSSRMHEIGVRLALGADARRVITLVLGEGLRLAAIGTAIGVAGALTVARLLQGLIVGVAPSDPRILAAGAILMLAVACAAAWLPARRASAVDPMVVLRE